MIVPGGPTKVRKRLSLVTISAGVVPELMRVG
jgi:hypothetical protein